MSLYSGFKWFSLCSQRRHAILHLGICLLSLLLHKLMPWSRIDMRMIFTFDSDTTSTLFIVVNQVNEWTERLWSFTTDKQIVHSDCVNNLYVPNSVMRWKHFRFTESCHLSKFKKRINYRELLRATASFSMVMTSRSVWREAPRFLNCCCPLHFLFVFKFNKFCASPSPWKLLQN